MSGEDVRERMRKDWDRRAREDAHYYVAFGRREQSDDEFFATAGDVLRSLRGELKRLGGAASIRGARLLEIGCGPARLMKPLAADCAEIRGIDVSEEMVEKARRNLAGIANAEVSAGSGADLAIFGDNSFDFVYSYAVFQHVPSREVVFSYLRDARRVLRPGGVLRVQVNGLSPGKQSPNTWWGVSIHPDELREFAREQGMWLLALEGAGTQYLWTTMRKPAPWAGGREGCAIVRVTSAASSEPAVPASGRYAAIAMLVEGLPAAVDLLTLEARFGGGSGEVVYVGPPSGDGLVQVNALLPAAVATGASEVSLWWQGEMLADPRMVRIVPPPPPVPRIVEVMDGIDIVSGRRIVSGQVKIVVEDLSDLDGLAGTIGGHAIGEIETLCVDPRVGRWEINCRVPGEAGCGTQQLALRVGGRAFAQWLIDLGGG